MSRVIRHTSGFDETFTAIAESLRPDSGLHILPGPYSVEAFQQFSALDLPLTAELTSAGSIEVMPLLDLRTAALEGRLFGELYVWGEAVGSGQVYNGSAGWTLPCGAVRSPDAAWLSEATVASVDPTEFESFARVVPDFIAEVRSKSDKRSRLEAKMVDTWMDAGVRLAWLIDPIAKEAIVYRQGQAPERISDFSATLSGEDVLEGFGFKLALLG